MNEDIQTLDTGLDAVPGFYVQGVHCGIKKVNNDLAVIYSPDPATAAAVFTTNRVLAAPVTLTREHLEKRGQFQMVVVNSGVANACTGQRGREDAQKMVEVATREFDLSSTELVAVASTGVIGDFLPLDKIEKGIQMVRALYPKDSSGKETARAIMTTDTFMKEAAVALSVGGKTVHIAGIAKGSGMIRPHMATMLGFLLTDATVKREALQSVLREAVDLSFNRVTVDGDTSTNDMVLLLANGKSGTPLLDEFHPDFPRFRKALIQVCQKLAKDIARDGEGATKFINIIVRRAPSEQDARTIAFTVAESPLVKTALFGEDPNWGRIMAAVGRSGVNVIPEKIMITINGYPFVENGMGTLTMTRNDLRKVIQNKELEIVIDLGLKDGAFNVWTCDLSFDYIKINSHYS